MLKIDDVLIVEDEDLYHSKAGKPFISSHLLSEFRHCPFIFERIISGQSKTPDSDAFALGRAFHTLVLEGEDEFQRRFEWRSPVNPKTTAPYGDGTKAYKDWSDSTRAQGLQPISQSQAHLAYRMQSSLIEHEEASELLALAPYRERVIRLEYRGHQCQVRIDACGIVVGIVDLKSCKSIDSFPYDARNYGYFYQLAFYRKVLQLSGLEFSTTVNIVAVEKKSPYRVGVWTLSPTGLSECEEENEFAMKDLLTCMSTQVWPTLYEHKRELRN